MKLLLLLTFFILKLKNISSDIDFKNTSALLTNSQVENELGRTGKILVEPGTFFKVKRTNSVRDFIRDYNSFSPVAVLVDDTEQSNRNAYNFINELYELQTRIDHINFMLVKFNHTGITQVLETTINDKQRFFKLLTKTQNPSSYIGTQSDTSAGFYAILNAAHILDRNCGILLFIDREVSDEKIFFAQLALQEVKRKNIRVYVVWGGMYPSFKNEEAILKEVAIKSGGLFLTDIKKVLSTHDLLDKMHKIESVSTILNRKNLNGEQNINFPIDSEVSVVVIIITGIVNNAVLSSPSGRKIDLTRSEDVRNFSPGSFNILDTNSNLHETLLNITGVQTLTVGTWHLNINNAGAFYNITILVDSKLTANAKISFNKFTDLENIVDKKYIKLGVQGENISITNVNFVNENGLPLEDKVHFKLRNEKLTGGKHGENVQSVDILPSKQELYYDLDKEKFDRPIYAVINGKDASGTEFQRVSYVNNKVANYKTDDVIYKAQLLVIEVGLGSQLITSPKSNPTIYYTVTNNADKVQFVRFYCRDDKSNLLSLTPWWKWLNPQESTTVTLTLTTNSGSYKNTITFSASGLETKTQKTIIDVVSSDQKYRNDDTKPELDYHFNSDCANVLFGKCEDGSWTLRVVAKDSDSGLLQVTSEPKGLYFPEGFTVGTNEAVTGYFRDSCCNPDIKVIAVDRQNNRREKNINAYTDFALGPGAIAAIVLGILLLICIIALIVWLIVRRRRKSEIGSYNLPTYKGRSTYGKY